MSPIIGGAIALIVIVFCSVAFPDTKPKPETDAQKLEKLIKKMTQK